MQTEFRQDSVKTQLSTDQKIRDKFKPLFCGKDFYLDHQNEFGVLQNLTSNLSQKNRLIVYTLTLCCLRRKNDWFSGVLKKPRKASNINPVLQQLNFRIHLLFEKTNVCWPKSLPTDICFDQFLSVVRIKAIPESAINGIFRFYCDDYNLQILDYEPTAHEILNLQIQNQRVLTFNDDFKIWPEKKYGERDFLSFLLHDFIHAEHFFSDPQKRLGQIGFYKFIQKIWLDKMLDEYLVSIEFNGQFSYLISDMNSHPIHLLQTFKAIIDQENNDPNTWQNICHAPAYDAPLRAALLNVNSPIFSDADAVVIMHFFENVLN